MPVGCADFGFGYQPVGADQPEHIGFDGQGRQAHFGIGYGHTRRYFFTVDFTGLDPIDAVYDRASLIALPPEMRAAYVKRLTALLAAGTPTLLLSLDYPQQEMSGPPFSVAREEIEKLYGAHYEIEPVHSTDCLAREPKFRDRGLSRLDEQVYVLR